MASERLPGKVLMPLEGVPILEWVVRSAKRSHEAPEVVVATSEHVSDDPIANWCSSTNTLCFRGPLDDVARRVREAAAASDLKVFARVCGDSPLLDHRLIDRAFRIYRDVAPIDIVTNVALRTFPKGQSVEVVSLEALDRLLEHDLTPVEQEHVTAGFYARAGEFAIASFESDAPELAEPPLVVDTLDDLFRIATLVRDAGARAADLEWNQWRILAG